MDGDVKKPNQEQVRRHKMYMDLQRKEMLSEINLYYASKSMKRPVSDSEAIMYYIENGGAADFFERHGDLICPYPPNDKI